MRARAGPAGHRPRQPRQSRLRTRTGRRVQPGRSQRGPVDAGRTAAAAPRLACRAAGRTD